VSSALEKKSAQKIRLARLRFVASALRSCKRARLRFAASALRLGMRARLHVALVQDRMLHAALEIERREKFSDGGGRPSAAAGGLLAP
jgi:hypothetical protein